MKRTRMMLQMLALFSIVFTMGTAVGIAQRNCSTDQQPPCGSFEVVGCWYFGMPNCPWMGNCPCINYAGDKKCCHVQYGRCNNDPNVFTDFQFCGVSCND